MQPVFIIAEAGVNHNGSMDMAKALIDAACEAGADAIKFQTAVPELLMTATAEKAEYQKATTGDGESQLEMIRRILLPLSAYGELQAYAQKKGIIFFSTPFDQISIDLLADLDIPIFKIPSGEITNLPYLRAVARAGKPLIISTGMSSLEEVRVAFDVLRGEGVPASRISILHCTTEYPAPMSEVNLKVIKTLKDAFNVTVGYSDHTVGIEVAIAAVALGAEIIEKHFTLDRNLEGPDHAASLDPGQLKDLVQSIRNVELAISGDGIKKPSPSELRNIPIARRSIVAKKPIQKGEKFTELNMITKRPGTGLSPMHWDHLLGTYADRDYKADDMISMRTSSHDQSEHL